jgi:dimethylaniline monooxygenase (N-oxide forming)
VLVIGNSISGLEVASELATDPTIMVISSCRKPRYIITKILGGLPADCAMFTRFGQMLSRAMPPEKTGQALKDMIVKQCGSPEQYGGLKPADNVFAANVAMSQYYLAQVAEGKILPKGAVLELTKDTAVFGDGTSERIDAIVFGTGYELSLPFLAKDIQQSIGADGTHIDLYCHTFHPDLPNLAFIGLYVQIGPYFPVLELQARWIAMVWSGIKPFPTREKMLEGIREFQEWKRVHYETFFDEMAVMLSKEAGVAPTLDKHPELAKALVFGPLASSQFRLDGHGRRKDAGTEFLAAASSFGNITSPQLTDEQTAALTMIANIVKDEPSIAALLSILQKRSQPSQ